MNELWDVWCIMYCVYWEVDGFYLYWFEGLWVMLFEFSVNMVVWDVVIGIIYCLMVFGGVENYFRIKEIVVFCMDCGKLVEVVSIKVWVEWYVGSLFLFDG